MSATKQDLLSLKEENMKMKDNFKNFLKKYKTNKKYVPKQKVMEFMEEQDSLMDNLNLQIDNILVNNEKLYQKPTKLLPKKRKIPEILPFVGNKINPKRPRMEFVIVKNSLENIINNPGLQHLAENIFSYLNYKDLESCQHINTSSKLILANPRFWLNKFIQKGMSKKNQNDWIKAIQLMKDTEFKRNLQLYLKRILRKEKMFDIPCYIDDNAVEISLEFNKKFNHCGSALWRLFQKEKGELLENFAGCLQLLVSHYNKVNLARINFDAAESGDFKIIQVVAPLMENPNSDFTIPIGGSESIIACTPISCASKYGHLEIVKFLVPLSERLQSSELEFMIWHANNHPHVIRYLRSLSS